MDWIKIKPQHHLFSDLTEKEGYALIKIQCLTGHLEKMPTREQMLKVTHYKTLTNLQERLKRGSITLQDILNRVLIDVQEVNDKKTYWKEVKQKQRRLQKNVHKEVQEKSHHREDKIREDKIKVYKVKKTQYSEFVSMTEEEYKKLIAKHNEVWTKKAIEMLNIYKGSSGKKYKSDYMAILGWVTEKMAEQKEKTGGREIRDDGIDPEMKKAYMKRLKEKGELSRN